MNGIKIILFVIVLFLGFIFVKNKMNEKELFEKHERLVAETTECLETEDWLCAERGVRQLLKESPGDKNLELHLAGIFFEQERYEECLNYIANLGYASEELEFLKRKSESLLHEMKTLRLERSSHFRLEFEGHPSRNDVLEALSVLEVAYDSLCRLFEFYPENKMKLVLYESSEFQGVGPRPDWVGAVFDGKLRIPVNVMQYREVYRPMFFHELTHAFVRAMTRSKVPLWLNEGIAQVVDASRNNVERPSGAKPILQSLTELFVKENNAEAAVKLYWYSQRMVENMLKRDSDFVHFRKFIQNLRKDGIDVSLQKFYNVTAQQLLDEV